jgi:hypothetical protein
VVSMCPPIGFQEDAPPFVTFRPRRRGFENGGTVSAG